MKNEEDDRLDDLLRSKLARKDFVFKEAYWEQARSMMEQSRAQAPRTGKKYVTLLIAGITLVLVSVATINYSISRRETAGAEQEKTQVREPRLSAGMRPALAVNEPGPSPAEAVPVNKAGATPQLVRVPAPPGGVENRYPRTPRQTAITQAVRPEAENAAGAGINARAGKPVATFVPPATHGVSGPELVVTEEPMKKNGITGEIAQVISGTKVPEPLAWRETAAEANNDPKGTEEGSAGIAAAPGATDMEAGTVLAEAPAAETAVLRSAGSETRRLAGMELIRPLEPSLATLLVGTYTPVTYEKSRPRRRTSGFLLLEAGATWYNVSENFTDNFNWHAAGKFGMHLGKRTDLTVGIGYSRLHQSKGTRTYDVISYDLDAQVMTNGVNTIRLDYLELPVSVYYALHGRHGLTAGASFLYLVRSADLLKKPEQTKYNIRANGYFGAFSPFDVQLNMGYTYMISPRIMLSGSYHYGVVDITKNQVFRSGTFDRNSGARLSIAYQIH